MTSSSKETDIQKFSPLTSPTTPDKKPTPEQTPSPTPQEQDANIPLSSQTDIKTSPTNPSGEINITSTNSPQSSQKLLPFIITTIIIVAIIITGGIIISRSSLHNQQSPTPTPTATPTPEIIDLSQYTLQVQNGSGISGQAGQVATLLEKEGFSDIDTANADSYDYQETVVSLKKDVPLSVYQTIEQILKQDYSLASESSTPSSDYDITIIVGQKEN